MSADPPTDLTALIAASRAGDADAKHRLFDLVYNELKRIARQNRYVDHDGGTMQATVLANEAYVMLERRLPPPPADEPESRETFFRTVALAMRTILREYWRQKNAEKRGGGARPVALAAHDPAASSSDGDRLDFLALNDALDRLERYNPRWYEVVLHRYFAGRTIEDTAALLGLSAATVKLDWQLARAWLRRELRESGA